MGLNIKLNNKRTQKVSRTDRNFLAKIISFIFSLIFKVIEKVLVYVLGVIIIIGLIYYFNPTLFSVIFG